MRTKLSTELLANEARAIQQLGIESNASAVRPRDGKKREIKMIRTDMSNRDNNTDYRADGALSRGLVHL